MASACQTVAIVPHSPNCSSTRDRPGASANLSAARETLSRTLAQLPAISRACRLQSTGELLRAGSQLEHVFENGLGAFALRGLDGHALHVMTVTKGEHVQIGDHGSNHVIVPALLTRYGDENASASAATPPPPPIRVALRIQKARHSQCTEFWDTADVAVTLAGARAWPALMALGCCAYPKSIAGNASSSSSVAADASYLFVTVRPLRRPFSIRPGVSKELPRCASRALDDRRCALNLLQSSFVNMHALLESPLRVRFREHYQIDHHHHHEDEHATMATGAVQAVDVAASAGARSASATARGRELPILRDTLKLSQFCQDVHDGSLAVCDVGHTVWDPRVPVPRAPTSVELVREWVQGKAQPPRNGSARAPLEISWGLADALHFLLRTLRASPETSAVYDMVPELAMLAREVEDRHLTIEARCSGSVEQMSFACAAHWLNHVLPSKAREANAKA